MWDFLLLLLLCSTVLAESSADEPPDRVFVFVGRPAILPCLQRLPPAAEDPTIEWSRRGLDPPFVFVYRQNFEVYGDKHPDYEFRTHLFMTKLQHGNFSMRLSGARKSDAGTYVCKTLWINGKQDVKQVELVVVDLPEPELSAVWSEGGALGVSCVVHSCSAVVPRLTILDRRGKVLEAEKHERIDEESGDCYKVEQKTRANADVKSVVCRAELMEFNQSKETHMLIQEVTKESCLFPMVYAGTATGAAILVLAVVAFLIYKCCCKSGEKWKIVRQNTDDTTTSGESEQHFLASRSTTIEMPEFHEETHNTLTEQPDLLCSTPTSVSSKTDGEKDQNGSVFDVFPQANAKANGLCDEVVVKPANCEMNGASKSVTFQSNNQRKKLTRQDASPINSIPAKIALPNVTLNQANGASKAPVRKYPLKRSQSATDSSLVPLSLDLRNCRRCSLSVTKFEKLKEVDPELESFIPKAGKRE